MKCALFLAEGFEECEALITVDLLRRAEIQIDMVSIMNSKYVKSSHEIEIKSDYLWDEIDVAQYDGLILPGGKLGTMNLESFEPLKDALLEHFKLGKLTCAICAAPSILGHLGILKGKQFTCFPTFYEDAFEGEYQEDLAVTDGNVITGKGMGASIEFARHIILFLKSDEDLVRVENGIQYVR